MSDYRSIAHMRSLNAPSLLGRVPSTGCNALVRLVREMRGSLFPSVVSGGAFFYLQSNASAKPLLHPECSAHTDLLLIMALVTYLLCDTACGTALAILNEGLAGLLWHRVRERRQGFSATSTGRGPGVICRLCSSSYNQKDCRPRRSTQISHNRAPPEIQSLPIFGCT